MIDRREVMNKAWADYRSIRSRYSAAELAAPGIDASFAASLRFAWKICKEAAARVAAEQVEAMSPNAPAIRAVRKAIEELQFKGFKHNISAERRVLETKLASLMAA